MVLRVKCYVFYPIILKIDNSTLKIREFAPQTKKLMTGVPQGSVLSPFFFLDSRIDDLSLLSEKSKVLLFVDEETV